MLLIREVFTAKPGMASKLAKLFKETMTPADKFRVMTDMVGNYNTVVVEFLTEKLSDFEKEMEEYRSQPRTDDKMSGYTEMYMTGRREIYRIL